MKNRLYKFLSILLSVLVLFSVCIVPTVASAGNEQTIEYYVKNPGYDNYGTVTDADGSKEKPFETVYDLVTHINENTTYGAGDTVNVYIMQQSNVKVFNSSTGIHNMTSWTDTAANAVATIPDHAYTLVLKSPEGQNNYLAFSHRLADNVDMMLSGPTVFDNVTVVNVRNSKDKAICFEGNDATFTENCQYKYLQWAYYTASKTPPYEWGGSFQAVDMPLQMYRVTAEKTFSETTSINVNSSVGKLYIPSWRTNNYNVTYSEDVNITVDNALADLSFVWGINHRSTTTTFAKNLNINIKSAAKITNILGNATASNGVGAVNVGALQIIAPKGFAFDTSALTNLTISKTDDTENYWYIENGTGVKDILAFTETAGVFEVAQGYYGVTITDENNQKQNITDGKVNLPAGKYSVSIVEERTEFYVQNPGYDNYNTTTANGTKEKPFETVLDAVTYINSATDYDSDDAVTIYILQQSDIKAYNNATGLHNMTSWTDLTADGVAAIPAHKYKLTLKSPDGENNYLAYSNKLADNVDMMLGGPTVFDNVTLVNVRNNADKAICLEGYDAEFTENCDFKYLQHAYEPSSAKPQYDWNKTYYDAPTPIQMSRLSGVKEHSGSTITLNTNNAKLYLPTLRTNNYDCTYTDDVEIIVNNANAEIEFVWGNANEAGIGTTNFKGNLTFDIKSAKKIVNTKANGPVVIDGALQIMVDSAASVSGDVADFSNVSVDADSYWYVKNMLGNGAVSFTDTAGVYETTNTDAIAIDSNNVEHNQTNGEFTLPSGVYDINTKEIRLDTYYVRSPGYDNYNTVTNADGTKDKPFETVYDLVAYLNAKTTFGAGDTVNVCVLQLDGVTDYNSSTGIHNMTSWTDSAASGIATVPSHEYTLSISSPESENNYLAYSNKLADNVDMMLSGPTVFDNVTVVNVRNNADKAICLEGYDAEFTQNCDFKYLEHAYEPSSAKPQYDWNKTYYDAPTPIQMSRLSGVKEHSGSTITLNTNNAKLYLPTLRTNNYDCTFTGDVKIIVNNSAAEVEFVWGNANEAGIGTTNFKGNLTFDIKSAKKITNTEALAPVVIDGALQILVDSSVKVNGNVADFSNVTVDEDSYWYIKNMLGFGKVSFTDTVGIFETTNAEAFANDAGGKVYNQSGGRFTLTAGNYVIKIKEVRLDTYYVKSPGYDNYNTVTNADGTKDKPFETVYDLVAYLNAKTTFGAGDTVNVCILQLDGVTDYNSSTGIHNMTSWTDTAASGIATVPSHEYTLSISSPESENNYLAYSNKLADNVDMMLSGPTVFDNVTVVNVRNNADKAICLEGYDAEFTENSDFKYLEHAYEPSSAKPQYDWNKTYYDAPTPIQMSRLSGVKEHSGSTITLNTNNAKLYLPTLRTNNYDCTFTGDVKIIVNNSAAEVEFVWGNANEAGIGTTNFKGNLTFDIKSAKKIVNTKGLGPVVIDGALQILIEDDSKFLNEVNDFENVTVSQTDSKDNYWHLRNGTNVADALAFTETAGTYTVKSGMDIVALAEDGSEIAPKDNKLSLAAGSYIIKYRGVEYVDPLTIGKMIYFKNGSQDQYLSAWVSGTPGKTYIFTYSVFSTQDITPSLRSNGKRNSVNSADSGALGGEVCQLLNEQQHENYTTYTYKITIPQNYVDNYNESPQNYKVFLGFNMPLYAEGYLFDIACYEEGGDPNVSAWVNGEFDNGFDGWIWGWLVTWFTSYGKGLTEWSDSYHEIRILDCDLSLIDALIADINRDDGVWWKPTDIIEYPEEIGYATFKGSYVDQNGEPLSNVKMILKSEDNTYTAYTDANGKFTFKNIVEGYYELYYVNSNGEEINTDFAYNFSGGDTVTINLVNDSSPLTSELKGTVYTPQLEVVPNLKIYLRGFGETVTDKDGNFTFAEVPVGKYELYTILEDGSEYVFRTVEIKENVDLAVKLKYAPETVTDSQSGAMASYWIWIIIGCGAVLLIAAGVILFIILKKKKKTLEEK